MIVQRPALPLKAALFAPLLGCLAAALFGQPVPPVLTTAAAVRMLGPDEAARGRAVRLSGTVLLVTRLRDAFVLRDDTEGIYVALDHTLGNIRRPGAHVEVIGVTDPGDFAPIVRAKQLVWGDAGPLPAPRPITIAELNAGGYDAAWVELEGIVRSCSPTPPPQLSVARGDGTATAARSPSMPDRECWTITLAEGDDLLTSQILDHAAPELLVDAKVRLRGVVFNVHNASRQFVRASLQIAEPSMIDILTPPLADPFARPQQHIDEILGFTRAGFSGHRIRVRGVVTGHQTGKTLWVRERDRGLRVATEQPGALAPGDEVDVVGFADHGGYAPSLSHAIFRKIQSGPPPAPQALHSSNEISREDSNLVQIEAALKNVRRTADGLVLDLDWNGIAVSARLPGEMVGEARPEWEPGSGVRAIGICLPENSDFARPTGLWVAEQMQLLLRGPQDLIVLRAAPWLTTRRAFLITLGAAVGVLVALIVVSIRARRQIAQRDEARKLAEVEFSAMLAERNRLAREIHDTLAQELNAISIQMELAKHSAKSGAVAEMMPFLSTAHEIVRRCLAEARESIWNMRSHILEKTDLAGALRLVAEQMSTGRGCTITARTQGRARRLAPMIENNLLRIGQEAVSNALKHAGAKTIALEIVFGVSSVRLVIADDGCGFDVAANGADGQFGLRGMRERVEQMHGELHFAAREGGGTSVEVIVNSSD